MTLEELLNKLIGKGRVPFGDEKIHSFEIIYVTGKIRNIVAKRGRGQVNKHKSIIELCSKSSGLWQFVCENRKYGYTIPECWIKNPKICDEGIECVEKECNQYSYEYYIIESSLKDESELEQFLLDNIQLGQ